MSPLRIIRIIEKADRGLAKGEEAMVVVILSVMTAVVFLQVLFRYLLSQPLAWSEEAARYLFVWLCLMSASLGVHKGGHFGFDLVQKSLPARGKQVLGPVILCLMGVVVGVLFHQGIVLVQKTRSQESPAMLISMALPYLALPTGAGLMAFHLLSALLQEWSGEKREGRPES